MSPNSHIGKDAQYNKRTYTAEDLQIFRDEAFIRGIELPGDDEELIVYLDGLTSADMDREL